MPRELRASATSCRSSTKFVERELPAFARSFFGERGIEVQNERINVRSEFGDDERDRRPRRNPRRAGTWEMIGELALDLL
jgi:hypothetical protein